MQVESDASPVLADGILLNVKIMVIANHVALIAICDGRAAIEPPKFDHRFQAERVVERNSFADDGVIDDLRPPAFLFEAGIFAVFTDQGELNADCGLVE